MLKQLKIYYIFVSLPFIMLLIGVSVFFDSIKSTITRNPHPQINYTIFVIILVGGVIVLLNARRLMREAKNLAEFSRAIHSKTNLGALQEMANGYSGDLACILQMVAASGDRSISHQEQAALEHELTNVRSRLNRRNALPQYLTGLLVGMGLLGTFIGLLATLNDISVLITSFADLDMKTVDPIKVFGLMIDRMKAPMQSMGIAFSASMFGLLGSIVLGLMMVGIRRLQGDISSLLGSEIARHIEIALSFESISFRGGEVSTGGAGGDAGNAGGLTAKILLRIEERLAEAGRVRQRALSAEIDDFKKQRADMMQALTEQTEASNHFRNELQKLGSQLGTIFSSMEKGNGEMSAQISELTSQIAGAGKETHKLLAIQVDEQKGLRDKLDSFKIETTNSFRSELQKIGSQLCTISDAMEKGSDEISSQISELTVHMAADAKESQRLLNMTSNNVRSELQKLGSQLGSQLGTISSVMEKGNGELMNQISEMMDHMDGDVKESHEQRADMLQALAGQIEAGNDLRSELQRLGSQLDAILNVTQKGTCEISAQISELMDHRAADAKASYKLLAMLVNEQEAMIVDDQEI